MKRRIAAIALAVMMVVGLLTTAQAYTTKQMRAADALYHLGLFQGRTAGAKNYDLDSGLNRAEGTLVVIRLLGKEAEAYNYSVADTPFTDVANFWTSNNRNSFIGYAYQTNMVKGMSATEFGPQIEMKDQMFLTMVLRVLGYQDGDETNYVWYNAYTLAKDAGLIDNVERDATFTRGDAVVVAWKALSAEIQGTGKTLADQLIAEGIFTAAEYTAAKQIWTYGSVLGGIVVPTPSAPQESQPPSEPEQPDPPVQTDPPAQPDPPAETDPPVETDPPTQPENPGTESNTPGSGLNDTPFIPN